MKKFKFLDAVYYAIAARSESQADARRKAKDKGFIQARAARAFVIIQKIRDFKKHEKAEQKKRDCQRISPVVRGAVNGNPLSMQERRRFIRLQFCEAFFTKFPSFHDIKVSFSQDINFPSVSVYKTNLCRYSSRRTYNKIKYNFNIVLPKNYLYNEPRIIVHSGQAFWYVSKKIVKNCIAYKCITMNKTSFLPKYKYIVNRNGIFYTGKTLKDAVKRAFSSATLTLNSKISRSKYALITGACKPGIEKFCYDHNLENAKTVTVRELLSIMNGTEFGYEKFKNTIIGG